MTCPEILAFYSMGRESLFAGWAAVPAAVFILTILKYVSV
jgi:hypothetical protein